MKRTKRKKHKKRIPAHLRIPANMGFFTWSARRLYDLIYSFGLGGCWMSNSTLAEKLLCSRRTIQYARKQLTQNMVIIIARTCPRTWIMWARYHLAVLNCPILLYPIRQEMSNPYHNPTSKSIGVQSPVHWGAKIAPKLDVVSTSYLPTGSIEKETAKALPIPISSQGSAPNPASSSGLTSNQLIGTDTGPDSTKPDPGRDLIFKVHYDRFRKLGYEHDRALSLTNQKMLDRSKKRG